MIKDRREVREERKDIQAFDKVLAREEESFPAEVVERLIAGESTVKVFREYRGLSQAGLAERAGINSYDLEQIEEGKYKPSRKCLARIADGLGLDVCDLD